MDCIRSPGSAGHNLIGNTTGCGYSPGPGDLTVPSPGTMDPLLGPLEDNGGPTDTRHLLPGCPAIDMGDDSILATPPFFISMDQRGLPRPMDGDGDGTPVGDIGAFELQGSGPPPPVEGVDFYAMIDGAQEVPPTPGATAMGIGLFNLSPDHMTLDYHINVDTVSLIGPLTAAHIHMAPEGVDGDVVHPLNFVGGTAVGTWTPLDQPMMDALMAGDLYVNVHSSAFPAGEIRGQILPAPPYSFGAVIDGFQEVPPTPDATAMGTAYLTLSPDHTVLNYYITVDMPPLRGGFTAAHIHMAPPGQNGDVVHPLSFVSETAAGTWALDLAMVDALMAGNLYVNVHSDQFPGGEIRGNISHLHPPGGQPPPPEEHPSCVTPSQTDNVIYVDVNNTSGIEDGSPANPYKTIQAAVNAAVAGDIIMVKGGVYQENVVISTSGIHLVGMDPGAAAVIDASLGSLEPNGIRIEQHVTDVSISNFRIEAAQLSGASGIIIYGPSDPRHIEICNNVLFSNDRGVSPQNTSPVVVNNTFVLNNIGIGIAAGSLAPTGTISSRITR